MQSTVKLSCNIAPSNKQIPLGLEIWLNDQKIFDQNAVTNLIEFAHDFSDADGEHELRFVLKNKTSDHTKIDESGNIIEDAYLSISGIGFDEIQLGHMFTELATYTHNYNGTGATVQEKFYENMGCNGVVSLKFTTPIYLWLLENL